MGALLIREFGLGDGREAGLRSRYPQPWYRLASTEGFALSLIGQSFVLYCLDSICVNEK